MAKLPLVSIIIPTWNTAAVTSACVRTIQKYYKKNLEIIVVDNNSTDNTSVIFSRLKNIIYIKNSQNYGYARGCNIGAAAASADYLLFLNSDMEFTDNGLTAALSYLQSHPKTGIVAPQFLNPDRSVQGSVFPDQTPLNAFREFWLGQSAYSKYTPAGEVPVSVPFVSGGAILISKSDFTKIGGWNENYFMYYEDFDLCRSVCNLGKTIVYFPAWRLIHRHGVSGSTLASAPNQWRRAIPSAKKYFGLPRYLLIKYIIWSGQKLHRFLS